MYTYTLYMYVEENKKSLVKICTWVSNEMLFNTEFETTKVFTQVVIYCVQSLNIDGPGTYV